MERAEEESSSARSRLCELLLLLEERNREVQTGANIKNPLGSTCPLSSEGKSTEQELVHVVEKKLKDKVSGGPSSEQEAPATTTSDAAPCSSSDPDVEDPKLRKTEQRAIGFIARLRNDLSAWEVSDFARDVLRKY